MMMFIVHVVVYFFCVVDQGGEMACLGIRYPMRRQVEAFAPRTCALDSPAVSHDPIQVL